MITYRLCVALLFTHALLVGCASQHLMTVPTEGPTTQPIRDSERSRYLNAQAASIMESSPAEAEHLLRSALEADLFNGAAHNNLGVILLNRGELYEAAHEFEAARKLLPGHPDPRVNLALTLERAGRAKEAEETYESALTVYPGHLPAIMGLARVQVAANRTSDETATLLREIIMRASDAEWQAWAKRELTRIE